MLPLAVQRGRGNYSAFEAKSPLSKTKEYAGEYREQRCLPRLSMSKALS